MRDLYFVYIKITLGKIIKKKTFIIYNEFYYQFNL